MTGPELTTAFTELVGCQYPIQLAPMGGVGTLELATAVARAGGLGMVPAGPMSDDAPIPADTGAIGVNFLMPFLFDHDRVEAAARQARLVEFFWGPPDAALVDRVHGAGALAGWQVGSRDNARAAEQAGCDLVVAQGIEAGGHVEGTTPLDDLLDDALAVTGVPVVAAGGITTGADLARVLQRGAAAARVGTRFATAVESGAHLDYVQALLDAGDDATELTSLFGEGWPDAPHRVLRSSIEAARARRDDVVGQVDVGGQRFPLPVWSAAPPTVDTTGTIRAMALYAGTGVAGVVERQPAEEIVGDLVEEAARLMRDRRHGKKTDRSERTDRSVG